jgi:hypothetical protein
VENLPEGRDNAHKTLSLALNVEWAVALELSRQHGGYDLTISSKGSTHEMHDARHVETGAPSFSDPLMGRVV